MYYSCICCLPFTPLWLILFFISLDVVYNFQLPHTEFYPLRFECACKQHLYCSEACSRKESSTKKCKKSMFSHASKWTEQHAYYYVQSKTGRHEKNKNNKTTRRRTKTQNKISRKQNTKLKTKIILYTHLQTHVSVQRLASSVQRLASCRSNWVPPPLSQ